MPRIYKAGTTRRVKGYDDDPTKGGRPTYANYYDHTNDKPYYKHDGYWYSIVDHKPAHGYELSPSKFLPLDYDDLIGLTMFRELARKEGIRIPADGRKGNRTIPPPLMYVQNPGRVRALWNRDTVTRHLGDKESIKQSNYKKDRPSA